MRLRSVKTEQPHVPCHAAFGDILIPAVVKGRLEHRHYRMPSCGNLSDCLNIEMEGAQSDCETLFKNICPEKSISKTLYPYGLAAEHWWQYSMAPHSYLPVADGKIQIGLNYFNRFLHADFGLGIAELVNPGVADDMLSSTNFFDRRNGDILFASWSVEDTIARIIEPRRDVITRIWRYSETQRRSHKVWEGVCGDSIHQVALSPDGRFLLVIEIGLVPAATLPRDADAPAPGEWESVWREGLIQSRILVLDLLQGRDWSVFAPAAAHVEFDPSDPSICYLSSHNIGLAHGKVCIFGPGSIFSCQLGENGPCKVGEFSAPDFYRITTHIVFSHRGRSLIGVTGYPDTLFLIDSATMRPLSRIRLLDGEVVDTSSKVHLCRQDSYGIASSEDGEYIIVAGTGFISEVSVDEGKIISSDIIGGYSQNSCFTGHICAYRP